jgi:prepilin-type N-terminal cleavage/methylation domain-containing protein
MSIRVHHGFTIVELLIVIVVIGILAAITLVAYGGIQERARFSSMRSDLASMNKAIRLYHAQYGSYPITPGTGPGCTSDQWCGWDQATGNNFIPNIVPEFASVTPQLPASNVNNDTYLYRSTNGADFKLIRLKGGGLSASESSTMADLRTTGCPSTIDTDRWGYWSSDASRCW